MRVRVLIVSIVLLYLASIVVAWGSGDRILLEDVKAISLTNGKKTTGRRNSPIPQMKCVGGYCHEFHPSTALCKNEGFDGKDAVWTCTMHGLPPTLQLGRIEVACEGFDFPDDPYVLKGSCGLEYTLDHAAGGTHTSHSPHYASSEHSGYRSGVSWLTVILIVGVLWFIYRKCVASRAGLGIGGGGGGGMAGGPGGPGGGGYAAPDYGSGYSSYSSAPSGSSASSGPGFWTGAATGAAVGYMAGRRNAPSTSYATSAPYRGTSSGFSSSGGGGGTHSSSASGGTKRR